MKAVVIFGSPRNKKSASYHLGDNFSKGLRRAGVNVEEIMLVKHKINHCIGCYTCWTKTPGKCITRDDMDILLPKLQDTDLIVLATPLYIYSVPGIVKDFLDRMIPLAEPFLIDEDGVTGHPMREKLKRQKAFLISVAGFPELSHFDALVAMCKKLYRKNYIGEILVSGAEPMSKDAFQKGYENLYRTIEQAGFEVAKNGTVSEETQKAILDQSMITGNGIKVYRKMANKYWESLQTKDYSQVEIKTTKAKPLKMSDKGMAAFFVGMANLYDPKGVPGLKAIIQFNLDDDYYHLLIDGNKCTAFEGTHPEPSLTIISPADIWLKISMGEIDGAQGLIKGLYKVDGDMALLMKMQSMFKSIDVPKADLQSKSMEKFGKISEHRGPIKISGSLWLAIAFMPWILLWVLRSIPFIPGLFPQLFAACVSILITTYHIITNRPTLWEKGTSIYLISAAILYFIGLDFFIAYCKVIDYIFLGGLWLASILKQFSLSAEYTRLEFPKQIWTMPAFLNTNNIICGVWGIYYLCSAILNLIIIVYSELAILLMIISYVSLAPMFIFTAWFQKWYPKKMMNINK